LLAGNQRLIYTACLIVAQVQTLIAIISGMDGYIDKQKMALSHTIHPALGKKLDYNPLTAQPHCL